MSKPDFYDMPDADVLFHACNANIYDKLVTTWRENHADDLLRMFEEDAPGDWAGAAEDLKEKCEAWVAGQARDLFAGGLAVAGYSDAEDESFEEEQAA